jgi:hypothetical protein
MRFRTQPIAGNTLMKYLIKVANRLRLGGNPAADGQCPECDAGMKKELLQLHFAEGQVKALQG